MAGTYLSASGRPYTIGTERAESFINSASPGEIMTGGDGSSWYKNRDGSVSITKDGDQWLVPGNDRTYESALSVMQSLAQANSAASAEQASDLRAWQEQQNSVAMDFNAAEAAKNRAWQEYMSNTAHQREVADLKAAGLNPVLSASGGNGAAVTSGSTAQGVTSSGAKGEVDMSVSGAMASLFGTLWTMQNQLEMQKLNAQNNLAVADKYTAASELVAQISGLYGLRSAETAAAASRYHSDVAAEASMFSALQGLESAKYSSDMQYKIHEDFPSSFAALLNSVAGSVAGTSSGSGYIRDSMNILWSKFRSLLGSNSKFKNMSLEEAARAGGT